MGRYQLVSLNYRILYILNNFGGQAKITYLGNYSTNEIIISFLWKVLIVH